MNTFFVTAVAATTALVASCGGTTEEAADPPLTAEAVVPWMVVDKEHAQLQVNVQIAGCGEFDRLEVVETDESVTIEAIVIETEDAICATVALDVPATATLRAPVGPRSLFGCWPAEPSRSCGG